MTKLEKTIGGEKLITWKYLVSRRKNNIFQEYKDSFKDYFINYTFGGHYSILAVLDNLDKKKGGKILIPSYTCDSILKPMRIKGFPFLFYKIDSELKCDFHDIKMKCSKNEISAIVLIDYMGKSQSEYIKPHLNFFKERNIKIIQDSVHSLCLNNYNIYGDFVFNSFRKILPFEGSLLLSKEKLDINYTKGINWGFLFHKRIGQCLRYMHLRFSISEPSKFLEHFKKAEENYHRNRIYSLTRLQKFFISKVDIDKLQINSKYFYGELNKTYGHYTPVRFNDSDFFPLGFLLIKSDRDTIRRELQKQEIYCPVHWLLPNEIDKKEFAVSHEIAQKAVTIPLSDINKEKFDYLSLQLKKLLK